MCFKCHSGLSDEEVLKQLREQNSTDNINFIRWNTTSIGHLILAGVGLNGPEARTEAINLLEKFIIWRRTQPDSYVPETGLVEMGSADNIQKILDYIKQSNPDYSDRHSIMEKYAEFMKMNEEKTPSQPCLIQ